MMLPLLRRIPPVALVLVTVAANASVGECNQAGVWIVALNVDRGLISRVGREGWRGIPRSQREGVGDPAPPLAGYEARLAEIFAMKAANTDHERETTARNAAALQALNGPLRHYGRQSYLVFEASRVTRQGIWPVAESSVRVETAN